MKYRKDDLIGIRKARFASFVLLLVCSAAMLVILVLTVGTIQAYIAAAIVIAALVACWWFIYRNIMFSEAEFFESLTNDMRTAHRRLRILESAVRQISDGIVIIAADGDIVLVNETAMSLLAAFDGGLDGARYDEYAADFSEKLERKAILKSAQEGKNQEIIEVKGQFFRIVYIALALEKGKEKGAVALISDVTENTKVENMQIEFVANVSHELKTPLAIIKSYTETLMEGSVEDVETKQQFLEMINTEVDSMDNLIKELLYMARVAFTEIHMNKAESDLTKLVNVSMQKLDMAAKKKSLTVNKMFADDLKVKVEIDRNRMEQVIFNILVNAIKYSEEGGRVDVDIIPGQKCVQIVISDNGVGIPEEDLARVFERFFRGDKARTGKESGTGLGLTISKQIVEAHGGTIGIESKLGRGTMVTISLLTEKSRGTPGIE